MSKTISYKQIEGFPNYTVNPYGYIFDKTVGKNMTPDIIKGFGHVTLVSEKHTTVFRVDFLVATAFIPNPTKATSVNHKDGKSYYCSAANLEWATKSNMQIKFKQEKHFYVYYNSDDGKFKLYNSITNKITLVPSLPTDDGDRIFSLTKPYESTDEDMIRYVKDFNQSCFELANNKIIEFDYKFAYNHNVAVMNFLKQTSKDKYSHHTEQTTTEYKWSKQCPNSASFYCEPGTYQCYGYDFSFNHGTIMGTQAVMIPTRKGKEYFLDSIDINDLKVGYYRVQITSSHKHIKKVFTFSKFNVYTDIDVRFAINNKNKFQFKIELIDDDEPNAYLYKDGHLQRTSAIFDDWYSILVQLRKAFPKNILVKFLCSSLHGQLSSANTSTKTLQEVKDEKLDIGHTNESDFKIVDYQNYNYCEKEYYELLDMKKPYKYNIRLQSFLMAQCRANIAAIAMTNLDNVIRIHTDNVTFKDVDPQFKIDGFNLEKKTTGLLKWSHVNKCERLD